MQQSKHKKASETELDATHMQSASVILKRIKKKPFNWLPYVDDKLFCHHSQCSFFLLRLSLIQPQELVYLYYPQQTRLITMVTHLSCSNELLSCTTMQYKVILLIKGLSLPPKNTILTTY